MSLPYAYPTNMSGLGSILTYANTISGGIFGYVMLLAIWLVFFLGLKKPEFEKSALASTFITFVVSVLFASLGIVSIYAPVFLLVGTSALAIVSK